MGTLSLIVLNSAAGFYAASLWSFFAWIRFKHRSFVLAAINAVLCLASLSLGVASLSVGVAFLEFAVMGPPLYWLRWVVVPLLALPATIHLVVWIKAKKFVVERVVD